MSVISAAAERLCLFVRSSIDARDWFGCTLAAFVMLYAAATVCLGLGGAPARFFVERFHLRSASFASWAAFAPSPWMYNFENQVHVSASPPSEQEWERPPAELSFRYINHFPPRVLTFGDERLARQRERAPVYVYMQSRYRDVVVRSALKLSPHGGSAPGMRIERVALAP